MRKRHIERRYVLEAAILAAVALVVMSPWGCSRSPVAPGTTAIEQTFTLPNGVLARPGRLLEETEPAPADAFTAEPRLPDTAGTTGVIGTFEDNLGSTGGTITLTLDGEESFFSVPDGALEKTMRISVTVMRDLNAADRRITSFHFEPAGLEFDKPAQLSYRSSLKEGAELELMWWDPAGEKWVFSARAVVVDGYATFPIAHFSDYRTTERVSLGGQRSAD